MARSGRRRASDAVDGELRRELVPKLYPIVHLWLRSLVFFEGRQPTAEARNRSPHRSRCTLVVHGFILRVFLHIVPRPWRIRRGDRDPREAGDPRALPDPGDGDPGRHLGSRHARQVADGLREDARIRHPDRGAALARGHEASRRADPGPHPRAGTTGEGRPGRHRPREAPEDQSGVRGHAGHRTVERCGRRAHPHRDAGAAAGPRRSQAGQARRREDLRARRGGPDARHGVPAAGGSDRPFAPEGPPDHVLLGHARRRRGPDRGRVHEEPRATRDRLGRQDRGGGRSIGSCRPVRTRSSRSWSSW